MCTHCLLCHGAQKLLVRSKVESEPSLSLSLSLSRVARSVESVSFGSAQLSIKKSNSNCQSCAICLRAIETKSECDMRPENATKLIIYNVQFTVHILRISRVCPPFQERDKEQENLKRRQVTSAKHANVDRQSAEECSRQQKHTSDNSQLQQQEKR